MELKLTHQQMRRNGMIDNIDDDLERKTKADRLAKSEAARARRKAVKTMIYARTERLYSRLRKMRKSK
mgnify:CR=1 FL=1